MKKVIFELQSDVLTCGINTEINFLSSNDYIPGSVIRAGFAKDIYLSCDIENRDNIVEIKNSGSCVSCLNREICKNFSDMKFSFFYKKDCIPSPLTTKRCKVNPDNHPIKDIMLSDGIAVCEECEKTGGRMEDAKSYINYRHKKIASVSKNTMTHTAINYATRTALDGSLFSTRSLARGQLFEGYIDDRGSSLIDIGTTVYVGKNSSSGFGKLVVKSVEGFDMSNVTDTEIKDFTARYSSFKPENKKPDTMYVPILLLSDAKLGFKSDNTVKSTEEYKKLWREKLFGVGSIFDVETVYAQNRLYAGYDTSREWGEWKRNAEIHTLKGTSVLVSFPADKLTEAVNILSEMKKNGIGAETINGYGQIDVCNKIHLMGVK